MTNNHSISDAERTPVIKNCLGREDLQFIHTLAPTEKEACKTVEGYSKYSVTNLNLSIMKLYCHSNAVN